MISPKIKLFICHHPDQIVLYKNLSRIIKSRAPETKIILWKVDHVYFKHFDFSKFDEYFDEKIEFKFIQYRKNFFRGWLEIFQYRRSIIKEVNRLSNNDQLIDVFLTASAWLPINIALFELNKNTLTRHITQFTFMSLEDSQSKTDRWRTLFCRLYGLFFHGFRVKAISTQRGIFENFVYQEPTPGKKVLITSPLLPASRAELTLPYPMIKDQPGPASSSKQIIIFGNAGAYHLFRNQIDDLAVARQKTTLFFQALRRHYPRSQIVYKPHPNDGTEIMPGVNGVADVFRANDQNAEMMLDQSWTNITAVYTFTSSAIVLSSFLGLPSYTFYRYILNPDGCRRFDTFFDQTNINRQLILHIADPAQIGAIDHKICSDLRFAALEPMPDVYSQILNLP